jgi:hypothetical protein
MATLQQPGRIFLAAALAARPIHLAWGEGLAAWDTSPAAEPDNATALVAELGRRAAQTVGFVVLDSTGDIEMQTGRYKLSATPTNLVYVKFVFDFADAAGKTVRELGIVVGSTIKSSVPTTKKYYLPAEVEQPGSLYALDRVKAFPRADTVRQVFEYVLPF